MYKPVVVFENAMRLYGRTSKHAERNNNNCVCDLINRSTYDAHLNVCLAATGQTRLNAVQLHCLLRELCVFVAAYRFPFVGYAPVVSNISVYTFSPLAVVIPHRRRRSERERVVRGV